MEKLLSKKPTKEHYQWTAFKATFALFNKYWWKSFFGPFFAFAFSFIIYAILGAVMNYKIMFSGIAAMVSMAQGITGMPFAIVELKNSVLLKRIGASPVKTWVFTLVIVSYFLMIMFIILMYLMVLALMFTQDPQIFENLFASAKSFFTFIYGFGINAFMSITIGFSIAAIAKGPNQAQAMGMVLYFPFSFLSGQFLSPVIIAESNVMSWISRFVPFKYSTMYMQEGWANANPFDLSQGFSTFNPPEIKAAEWQKIATDLQGNDTADILNILKGKVGKFNVQYFDRYDHIVGTFYPILVSVGATTLAIKKFKWSSNR